MSLTTSGPNVSTAFAATSLRNVSTETVMPGASRRTVPTPAGRDALLVGGDFVGPGTRGVAPDVDQLRPFGHGFADAALDGFGLRSAAAGIERIGGDVKNRHHLRRGKINVHGLHG